MMGGDVNYILKTVAPVVRKFTYRGFALACIEGPIGTFRVAECATGAIVSDAFKSVEAACKAVKNDMRGATKAAIQKQINDAKYQIKNRGHELKPSGEFWQMMNRARAA